LTFAAHIVRALLESYLSDSAELVFRHQDTDVWIFPRGAGTPIYVHIDGDRADVFAGFTFRATVYAGDEGQEDLVIDCVEAVISGNAREFFDFGDLGVDDRTQGFAGIAFRGRDLAFTSGEDLAVASYAIPAWSEVPAR
jgi:hypothetical protein